MIRFHRRYGLGYGPFIEAVAKPAAVTLGVAVPFVLWYLLDGRAAGNRLTALFGVAATSGVYFLVVWLLEERLGTAARQAPRRLDPQALPADRQRLLVVLDRDEALGQSGDPLALQLGVGEVEAHLIGAQQLDVEQVGSASCRSLTSL